jgi:hypothetical protein
MGSGPIADNVEYALRYDVGRVVAPIDADRYLVVCRAESTGAARDGDRQDSDEKPAPECAAAAHEMQNFSSNASGESRAGRRPLRKYRRAAGVALQDHDRQHVYETSTLIIESKSITAFAQGDRTGLWTYAVAAAVFRFEVP